MKHFTRKKKITGLWVVEKSLEKGNYSGLKYSSADKNYSNVILKPF